VYSTEVSKRRNSSTAPLINSGRSRSSRACPGWSDNAIIALPSRLTVVSCPAITSRLAVPTSSSSDSRPSCSSRTATSADSRSSAGARRLSAMSSIRYWFRLMKPCCRSEEPPARAGELEEAVVPLLLTESAEQRAEPFDVGRPDLPHGQGPAIRQARRSGDVAFAVGPPKALAEQGAELGRGLPHGAVADDHY